MISSLTSASSDLRVWWRHQQRAVQRRAATIYTRHRQLQCCWRCALTVGKMFFRRGGSEPVSRFHAMRLTSRCTVSPSCLIVPALIVPTSPDSIRGGLGRARKDCSDISSDCLYHVHKYMPVCAKASSICHRSTSFRCFYTSNYRKRVRDGIGTMFFSSSSFFYFVFFPSQ